MNDSINAYEFTIILLFGLVFGSFLNCTAMRIVRREDFVHGRSRCIVCGHELGAADLLPVISWVFLRGACRYCKSRISLRYPLTELLFAALACGLYLRFGFSVRLCRDLVLAGCLFTLSLVDLESFEIPDGCLLIGLLAWIVSLPLLGMTAREILSHILSGAVYGAGMLTISLLFDALLKKESMGGGDIKLIALLGLYLGFLGAYFMILAACVLGLIAAGGRALFLKQRFFKPIPFGPSIAMAGYIMLLLGEQLAQWYLGLF